MTDALRKRTRKVCNGLVGTKHDVIHEVFELDGLLESKAPDADLRARLDLIVKMLHEDVTRLHGLVKSIEAAGRRDPRYQMAFVLVAESAAHILNAYNPFRAAADPLRAGPGGPLSGPCCPPG